MNQQQASSNPRGGSLKWLLIVLAVIVILGGGYLLYAKYGKKSSTATTATSPTATTSTPTTTTPSSSTTSDTNETQVKTLLDNFGKAYVSGNVTDINKYLTKKITETSAGDPQALWNYNSLPVRGYKVVDFNKTDSGYTAHILFFEYKGEPGPLNSEAGGNWQLAEYRTYKAVQQNGEWLIDGSSIIFRQ